MGISATRHRLLTIADLPTWMRDNDYLIASYRPHLPSLSACLRTAFLTINNDTVNVWTHFLGSLLFLTLTVYFLTPLSTHLSSLSTIPPPCATPPPLPLYISGLSNTCTTPTFTTAFTKLLASHKIALLPLLLAATLCMAFSSIFHTFWVYSPRALLLLSKLDFVGISLLCCGHALTGTYHLFYCKPSFAFPYYIIILTLEIATLFTIFTPAFSRPGARHIRAGVFCCLGASILLPLAHSAVLHHLTRDAFLTMFISALGSIMVYLFGAVIYVVRFPECCGPGAYDCWGASHQIMHLAVMSGCLIHLGGICRVIIYRLQFGCSLSPLLE